MNSKKIRKAVLQKYDYDWIKDYDFEVRELINLAIEETTKAIKRERGGFQ